MKSGMGLQFARKRIRAQSTLEYILVLAAVLLALIAAGASVIRPGVENTLNSSGNMVGTAANKVVGGLNL